MIKHEIELLGQVLSIADDLADLMCQGMEIKLQGAGYRDLDQTINTINAGYEMKLKYDRFHKSMDDSKMYEVQDET